MTKKKLSQIIKEVNKDNAPPDGWKKEDVIVPGTILGFEKDPDPVSAHDMSDKEVAASVDLDVSDFDDSGDMLDELRDIMDGNT